MHIWRPWKLPNFQEPPPSCPATSKILPPTWPRTSNLKRKEKIIQGWLLDVIRSFLQVGFCSQYQLINLVCWLSIDFYLFSWSQPRPQNYSKKLNTSFSPSSYSEQMCWGQGWAKASLSAFLWLYILVCTVVQKYHKMIFIYNYSQF